MTMETVSRSRPWIWGIVLVAAMALAVAVVQWFDLGWAGALVVMLLGISFIIPLVRSTERKARVSGCMSPAMQRYNRRVVASSFAYTIALFASVYIFKEWRPEGIAAWLIACLPSAGIIAMIWAMGRLLREEDDEYLRMRIVQSSLIAAGFLLVVATIWGFFEQFGLVPHVPSWAAVPAFAGGLLLANFLRWLRA